MLLYFTEELRNSLGENDLAVRMGGDEFVVMMENITKVAQVSTFADCFLQRLKTTTRIADHDIKISSSIGISLYPANATNIHVLIKQADTALYQVKEAGKNHYRFYNDKY